MIEDFSMANIIKGCLNSEDFQSPECNLLNRISEGEDLPDYPEYDPRYNYWVQMPGNPEPMEIPPMQFPDGGEMMEYILDVYGEYPLDLFIQKKY